MEPKLCPTCFDVPVVTGGPGCYRFSCFCGEERVLYLSGPKTRQDAIKCFNDKIRLKAVSKKVWKATQGRRDSKIKLKRELAAEKLANRLNFLAQQNPVGLLSLD